jgi:hypothetical protein
MQTKWDFAGSTDMWSTSAGGHLMKVANLTGFTVFWCKDMCACVIYSTQFREVVIRSIPISDAVASVNGRGTAWYV